MLRRTFSTIAIVALATTAAAGCGGGDNGGGTVATGTNGEEGPRVGLVTDIGGLDDRSFNAQANEGFQRARNELGATGSILESQSAADYEGNLAQQVQAGSDLVVGIGFLMADSVRSVAERSPDTNFAIIDFSYGEETPDNVRGILFREQEAGYLAGVLAGAVEEDGKLERLNDRKIVSVVGGEEIPPVERFIAGFQHGVMEQCPDCEVLVDYSQDFDDQAACQDRAAAQIARGSDIVFQVAGGCGLGALQAADERGVWGVGVDADQAFLGDHILTSAVKRVDSAVFQTIEAVHTGDFQGGETVVFGLAEDGVGIGEIAEPARRYEDVVEEARQRVLDGDVDVPESL